MSVLLGTIEPRLFTPPLRKLTKLTSEGFAVVDWLTKDLGLSLLPHQKWWLVHSLEWAPGPKPKTGPRPYRFRYVLTTKPRRNTKTTDLVWLAAYRLTHGVRNVLSSSVTTDTARESFLGLQDLMLDNPEVFGSIKIRLVNGQNEVRLEDFGTRYKIISANRRGGRGLEGGLLIEDEIREHRSWAAHSALEPAMTTIRNAQMFMASNAGDPESIVLNHYRSRALEGSDPQLGLFEWSAREDREIDDRDGWVESNPCLGRLFGEDALIGAMSKPPSEFKTENLNIQVPSLNPAVDPAAWADCYDNGDLSAYRERVVCFIDMSFDLKHISLVAAATLSDGRIRVETVAVWDNTNAARKELPGLLQRVEPRVVGWQPSGPAAAMATDLSLIENQVSLSGADVSKMCQEFSELVSANRISQNGDQALTGQVLGAGRYTTPSGWSFARRGGWCDLAYAAAGAAHLARNLPPDEIQIF